VKPNIILLTVDCWRGDHFSASGNQNIQTPNIDAFANQSTMYHNAYTCGGWTKIAITSLFSSTYPSMYDFCQGKLSEERPNLAHTLSQNNYETAGFTTNYVCGSAQGFDKGFNVFGDLKPDTQAKKFNISTAKGFNRIAKFPLVHSALSLFGIDSAPNYPSITAQELVEHGLNWVKDRESDQPYFMWLHFMDLHMPYRSSLRKKNGREISQMWQDRKGFTKVKNSRGLFQVNEQQRKRWQQLYAEETVYLDSALGYFFDQLKELGQWDDTVICLTADHGEEFYEHGSWGHSWNQLHKEGTRVPLILKSPEQTQAQTESAIVSHIDIAPTLLDFAGAPKSEKMLGVSLNNSNGADNDKLIYKEMLGHANSYRYRLCITQWPYKYIYDGDADSCHLFNIEKDPGENQDIYDKSCNTSKTFDRLRLKHVAKGALEALKGNLELSEDMIYYDLDDDPQVIERLRALGYMD